MCPELGATLSHNMAVFMSIGGGGGGGGGRAFYIYPNFRFLSLGYLS